MNNTIRRTWARPKTKCPASLATVPVPGWCIGKNIHIKATTADAKIIAEVARKDRLGPANNQTPTANATTSGIYTLDMAIQNVLVGAPIAESSLTC